MLKAKVSVVMPAYNCEKFVSKAIESILNQTYTNFELLIADDCSTDNTKEIINSFTDERIKLYHNSSNQGYLKASNLLLEKCSGEFITFQDADDFSSTERLSKLINAFFTSSDLFAVSSNVFYCNYGGEVIKASDFPETKSAIYEKFRNYSVSFVGSAIMIKKEVLEAVGGYNPFFNRIGSEDIYWFSQIIQKFNVLSLSEPLYYYRTNPHSVSHKNKSYRSEASFDVVVYYMNEREQGRVDHIQANEWEKANDMMRRFYISYQLNKGKILSFKEMSSITNGFFSTFKFYLMQLKRVLSR